MGLDLKLGVGNMDSADVITRLVYDLKPGKVVPIWEVEYLDNLFRYGAMRKKTYDDR
ncbi:MAG: hypothetical protein ACYTEL_00080 [Planctomycetota bacterium]|jgi:hypothetical protein